MMHLAPIYVERVKSDMVLEDKVKSQFKLSYTRNAQVFAYCLALDIYVESGLIL